MSMGENGRSTPEHTLVDVQLKSIQRTMAKVQDDAASSGMAAQLQVWVASNLLPKHFACLPWEQGP
jgi:hypothetical protein